MSLTYRSLLAESNLKRLKELEKEKSKLKELLDESKETATHFKG